MKFSLICSVIFLFVIGCNENAPQLSSIDNPSNTNSSLPRLFTDNTGMVFMSWIEEDEDIATLKYASYQNDSWSQVETIASDSSWFVNWADYPSIIAKDGKPIAAHWLDKIPGNTYSYNVAISRFDTSWTEALTPHNDGTATEHGFVSMVPASDSTFAAIWLDGRNTEGREHHEYSNPEKAMTLRGTIINKASEISESFEIDDMVCDCCNTSMTKTKDGFIAAYRDRTDEEIRDIYITKYTDGTWSKPRAVSNDNWEIAACPVNGPAIVTDQNTTAVAWFTGANGKPQVKLAISSDMGETFSTPILVDDDSPLGRVDVDINQDKIWVSWVRPDDDGAEISIKSYDFSGNQLDTYSVSDFSKSRSSGFPQITPIHNGLLVAYTDITEEVPTIKTAVLR